MRLAGCSSLASHDRQRRKMEVQPGRVAVGSLWKPSWERRAAKRRSGGCIRVDDVGCSCICQRYTEQGIENRENN